MIFEVNYETLQKPLSMIKSILTDNDYKGDTKTISLEATQDEARIYFKDEKMGTEMIFSLDGSEVVLPGRVSCSFSTFFEVVKVFKKTKEVLLIEQEGEAVMVGDGVYPDEILTAKETEEVFDLESGTPLFQSKIGVMKDGIDLASSILKKTDIPEEQLNTQSILLATSGTQVSLNAFSLYAFHQMTFNATIHQEKSLSLPKTTASMLLKLAKAQKEDESEWCFSEVRGEEFDSTGVLIQSPDAKITMFFRLDLDTTGNSLSVMYQELGENIKQALSKGGTTTLFINNIKGIGKVTKDDNVAFDGNQLKLSSFGYSAPLFKKLVEKGAVKEDGKIFILDDNEDSTTPILCSYINDNGLEKITTMSYRVTATA